MKRFLLTWLAGSLIGLSSLSLNTALAQGKMAQMPHSPSKMPSGKKDTRASNVYVCKVCKAYYPAAAAKNMAYKDPMGHKLLHMSKAPVGYKDGSKMKMDTKMDQKM